MAEPRRGGHGLRWAAGLALLAAGAVTLFDRQRREVVVDVPATKTGRGRPLAPASATSQDHGYETVDANVRALVWIMGVAIVLIVAGVTAVFAMYAAFVRQDQAVGPLTSEQQAVIVPPEPHLQADPARDIAVTLASQRQRLTTYGWEDPAHSRAHIPIARAMDLLVGQPLDGDPKLTREAKP